ncbi:MAG: DUF3500 domain-containing protein [Verrucomicrobiae bacterium]|nr:DUF3500 domain-containing protein [Verrucomicrobiae bacterium]
MIHRTLLAACLLLAPVLLKATPGGDMSAAAGNFLAALTAEQREKAAFPFDAAERENWHFIPKERNGLPLREMTTPQRQLAHALLNSGLSQRGYSKVVTIMSLEQILQDLEGPNRRFPRDSELYYFSVFGTPGPKGAWGWRVEGHHVSVNFTLVDDQPVSGTPSFLGSNPAEVRSGPRAGLRVLGVEEDLARELVRSLNASQRAVAVVDGKAPDDILTVASAVADIGAAKGLRYADMDASQRDLLERILAEYVGRLRGELAAADLGKIRKAGLGSIVFAWAGGLEPGQGHYYRVHGPTFLLEYDNTQNDANHVHAVWREFQGDFGRDILAEHYRTGHGKAP